jgi:hypothetical protein
MSCIPFCYSCGRPIDCYEHGLCIICQERNIAENKIIQQAMNEKATINRGSFAQYVDKE